jgi:ABC-2 type transport system ATP-binding protein
MNEPYIVLDDLRKSYGDTMALRGLSLAVNRGELFGLIGPDGAGKTTAMRITCGLVLPDGGSAKVLGFDCSSESRSVKERLGYMPQRFSLYQDLSVAENLRFFADMFGVSGDERRKREDRLMEFSRLGPFRARRARDLSGGMKQKLALSCTLIHTPDVLVLDEPTTGVDPISRKEFWNILNELVSEGLAVLVSTPYMDEAALCHRVALVHRGTMIAVGTPEEVTGHFRRKILEITGREIHEAWLRLRREPSLVAEVHRFGDRLHVVHDTALQADGIRRNLAGLDVAFDTVEPTVEDTFVTLMSGPEAIQQ